MLVQNRKNVNLIIARMRSTSPKKRYLALSSLLVVFWCIQQLHLRSTTPLTTRTTTQTAKSRKSRFRQSGNSEPFFHLVFSTSCSEYQEWQSYAFFYQVLKSGQTGNVTRIASGCSPQEKKTVRQNFRKQIKKAMSDRFHLHFTPNYENLAKESSYIYFNKAMGVKHWLDHGLNYSHNERHLRDAVFVLLDPDEFVIRPFRQNYSDEGFMFKGEKVIHQSVTHGRPMAQRYGIGTGFAEKLDIDELLNDTTAPSSLRKWNSEIIHQHFVVGPPYLATGQDFYRIVQQWVDFLVPVYFQVEKEHISEMYAYSVAAAHLDLPHQVVHNFMVSNVDMAKYENEEGWELIDQFDEKKVCSSLTVEDRAVLPPVLHYCQSYFLGPYFFSKYSLPRQFLSCNHPLLAVPNASAIYLYDSAMALNDNQVTEFSLSDFKIRKRHTFMVCQLLRLMNEAAVFFKNQHCVDEESESANFNESFFWESTAKY